MSRWDEGNFDTDLAPEILLLIVFQLLKHIQECLDDDERDRLLCGETEVMPSLDILLTLSKAYPNIALPALKDFPITAWKTKYLDIFEQDIDLPTDDKFRIKRRSIIQGTFSQLENLVESYV